MWPGYVGSHSPVIFVVCRTERWLVLLNCPPLFTQARTALSRLWYDKMRVCAVQLKRKLILQGNAGRMFMATCSPPQVHE